MTRLLCLPLLLLLALPLCAQEAPPTSGQPIPQNPSLLARMRDQLTMELQQTQRMLGFVNPNDTQTIEMLRTQQEELTKQLRDITQQMQTGYSIPVAAVIPPGSSDVPPLGMPQVQTALPTPSVRATDPRFADNTMPPAMSMHPSSYSPMSPNRYESAVPLPGYIPPYPNQPYPTQAYPASPIPSPGTPNWGNQDRDWDIAWGPKLPKELTEMKQSVDALKKEIADLKETVRALETQIQLLNRNIVLSDKAKENGN